MKISLVNQIREYPEHHSIPSYPRLHTEDMNISGDSLEELHIAFRDALDDHATIVPLERERSA